MPEIDTTPSSRVPIPAGGLGDVSLTPPKQASLWRNPDFLKFWTALSTSSLGQLMTVLPLVAILVLAARVPHRDWRSDSSPGRGSTVRDAVWCWL